MATSPSATILTAVEQHGLLLVHDQALPCVTALITGGPVAGSWWSHPSAGEIYNALAELEDRDEIASVKLVAGKETLVARRWWPALAAVGAAREGWQLDALSPGQLALLLTVDAADLPTVIDRCSAEDARVLERRLLAHGTSAHTPVGAHRKALQPWASFARHHDVGPVRPPPEEARQAFAAIVAGWSGGGRRRLLPWPS